MAPSGASELGCCGHGLPSADSRTPSHGFTGCGAFHRNAPTGGAAYGIPSKTRASPTALLATSPASVRTTSCCAAVLGSAEPTKSPAGATAAASITKSFFVMPEASP